MSKAVSFGVTFEHIKARRMAMLKEAGGGMSNFGSSVAGLTDLGGTRDSPARRQATRAKTMSSLQMTAAARAAGVFVNGRRTSDQERDSRDQDGRDRQMVPPAQVIAKSTFFGTSSEFTGQKTSSEVAERTYIRQHPHQLRNEIEQSSHSNSVFSAAMQGRVDALRSMLSGNVNVNTKDEDGRTALWYAARQGHLDAMKYLIDKGANVNISASGQSPLMLVLHTHETSSLGSLPNDPPRILMTPEDRKDAVELLVAHRASVNEISIPDGVTPLHSAVLTGDLSVLKILADNAKLNMNHDHNSDVIDTVDTAGQTALQFACARESIEMCGVLLANGARKNVRPDGERWEALLRKAAKIGDVNAIEGLLKLGVDPNADDLGQPSALQLACQCGPRAKDAVRILLEFGAEPDRVNFSSNKNALHVACETGNAVVVAMILDASDQLSAEHEEEQKMLLELSDRNGMIPLHHACKKDPTGKCVKLIIDSYSDDTEKKDAVNRKCKGDLTSLHLAMHYGSPEVVQLLLDSGADKAAKDLHGRTALDLAMEWGHKEATVMLGGSVEHVDREVRKPDVDAQPESKPEDTDAIMQRVMKRVATAPRLPTASELADRYVERNSNSNDAEPATSSKPRVLIEDLEPVLMEEEEEEDVEEDEKEREEEKPNRIGDLKIDTAPPAKRQLPWEKEKNEKEDQWVGGVYHASTDSFKYKPMSRQNTVSDLSLRRAERQLNQHKSDKSGSGSGNGNGSAAVLRRWRSEWRLSSTGSTGSNGAGASPLTLSHTIRRDQHHPHPRPHPHPRTKSRSTSKSKSKSRSKKNRKGRNPNFGIGIDIDLGNEDSEFVETSSDSDSGSDPDPDSIDAQSKARKDTENTSANATNEVLLTHYKTRVEDLTRQINQLEATNADMKKELERERQQVIRLSKALADMSANNQKSTGCSCNVM